ncbi:MAG TPA: hypothetical protein VF306_06965 [Pirellulales bacterium]
MDDRPVLLLVGDGSHADFADATGLMRASCRVVEMAAPTDAIAWYEAADTPPALVVIAAARPGRFGEESIERLRQRMPLAACVALLGSWCEGEMRSGAPWPGIERVYWHQWPQRFAQELDRLIARQCGRWSLPVTSSPEERLLWRSNLATAPPRGVVAIVANQPELAEWLVGSCQMLGWAAVWSSAWSSLKTQGANVVVWDAGLIVPQTFQRLQEIRKVFRNTPVVALADFARIDQQRRLMAGGAAAVLSKPLVLSDLGWQLSQSQVRQS